MAKNVRFQPVFSFICTIIGRFSYKSICMTDEQHNFKKIEMVGDRVLRLAAVELCNEIFENRYKATEIIDQLGSTKVFALIDRYKKLTPHKNDPEEKGHPKQMESAYETSI